MGATMLEALSLLAHLDPEVLAIVWLSFQVSLSATVLGAMIGLPLGAWIAVAAFPGRAAVTVLLNGMMGMPPVVLGVIVYLILSRSGPLGSLGLLYSPTAMVDRPDPAGDAPDRGPGPPDRGGRLAGLSHRAGRPGLRSPPGPCRPCSTTAASPWWWR